MPINRKIRITLSAFIALSLVGLAVLVLIHYKTRVVQKATFKEDENVKVKIDKIHYSGTKGGRLEWELEADSASRSRQEDLTTLTNVKLTFYAKDGTPYTLTAKEGTFRESDGEVRASGDVVVRSPKENLVLKARSLDYHVKTRKIDTGSPVHISSDRLDADGTGLAIDMDRENFRLLKNVKAVFKASAPSGKGR